MGTSTVPDSRTVHRMNALRTISRVAPHAHRSFQSSAPRQGLVSTIGYLGIAANIVGPGIPGVGEKYAEVLAKDEHKVLVWLGGMVVFGTMASMGGGKKEEAPADEEFDMDAFMK